MQGATSKTYDRLHWSDIPWVVDQFSHITWTLLQICITLIICLRPPLCGVWWWYPYLEDVSSNRNSIEVNIAHNFGQSTSNLQPSNTAYWYYNEERYGHHPQLHPWTTNNFSDMGREDCLTADALAKNTCISSKSHFGP